MQDDFNDNSLDASKWFTLLPAVEPTSSASEQNMRFEFQDRGYLVTQGQFDPFSYNGVRITGKLFFDQSLPFPSDTFVVATRTDGTIDASPFASLSVGIAFQMSSDPNGGLTINSHGAAVPGTGTTTLLISGGLPHSEWLDFEVIDDGVNLSLKVTDSGGALLGHLMWTTSTPQLGNNRVAFTNRERVLPNPFVAYLDDVKIEGFDIDGDGVADGVDNCPAVSNAGQADTDNDGAGDACDVCPLDASDDADGDGFCADVDNCPAIANPDQLDNDNDGAGDLCDADDDNDGHLDVDDNCPFDANADQADLDGDGVGDACDTDTDTDGDGVLNFGDACMATPQGEVIDGTGCSIAQQCPCDGDWKNHGAYVSCVAHASNDFVDLGLITEEEKGAIVSAAGQSSCGKKSK